MSEQEYAVCEVCQTGAEVRRMYFETERDDDIDPFYLHLCEKCRPRDAQSEIQDLQNNVFNWAEETFGTDRLEATLNHLKSEIEEIKDNPSDLAEWADAFLLFIQALKIAGFTIRNLIFASVGKLSINKKRKWGKPNKGGFSEHV